MIVGTQNGIKTYTFNAGSAEDDMSEADA